MNPRLDPKIAAGFSKAGTGNADRHAFLCLGPDCCDLAVGEAAWERLKKLVALTGSRAMRTKAQCLRVCAGGPWLVVYPEGVWYGCADAERIERIVTEHLAGGRVVEEWASVVRPLCGGCVAG